MVPTSPRNSSTQSCTWPPNRLRRTALRAAADPERWIAGTERVIVFRTVRDQLAGLSGDVRAAKLGDGASPSCSRSELRALLSFRRVRCLRLCRFSDCIEGSSEDGVVASRETGGILSGCLSEALKREDGASRVGAKRVDRNQDDGRTRRLHGPAAGAGVEEKEERKAALSSGRSLAGARCWNAQSWFSSTGTSTRIRATQP